MSCACVRVVRRVFTSAVCTGLRDGVNDNSTAAFLWETFTTKPFHDSGVPFPHSSLRLWSQPPKLMTDSCLVLPRAGDPPHWRHHVPVAVLYDGRPQGNQYYYYYYYYLNI